MKKISKLILLTSLLTLAGNCFAVSVNSMPIARIQPNGDTLHCFVTGDEFYHRLHDAQGYTILQNPTTGYWVYADKQNGHLVATHNIAGVANPAMLRLTPNLMASQEEISLKRKAWDIPEAYRIAPAAKTGSTNRGTINNLVIFIRFAGDSEISTPFSSINSKFNDSTETAVSMFNYFRHASYNQVRIPTYYAPSPNGNQVVSFQDSMPRSYYMPYDATTNPNGYADDEERTEREFDLLERAVNYINSHCPISPDINLDYDNDNYVDNICFVVKGTYTGWSDLLWPHKWSLYDRYVYINNKRVYTFNLQLEGSGDHYFGTSTFCHEMFHTLGAPDLYHYYYDIPLSPVGSWDLMESNGTPPQHMNAYMKYKYGNWIDSIPEITASGTYSLHSLADPENHNNCYKIASQEPYQFYLLEYRDDEELFETAIPGKGLLIYRIDTRFNGNADFDDSTVFDEVWLFRPGGNNSSTNGTVSQANFRQGVGRTSFSPNTNPLPWLTGNVIDTTIAILNIGAAGDSITFTYSDLRGCRVPEGMQSSHTTGTSTRLSWTGNAGTYRVTYREAGLPATQQSAITIGNSITLNGLHLGQTYEWCVTGICSTTDSASTDWSTFTTERCLETQSDTIAGSDGTNNYIPYDDYYRYTFTEQLYTPAEVGGARDISKISFNYAYAQPTSSKTNCTVYLGHTQLNSFTSTNASELVPVSSMQLVYTGDLNCHQGWNTFVLDSVFSYNGTDNLVIAIDDNSNSYDGSSYKFYHTNTNSYTSVCYYSDSQNPNPDNLSGFSGSNTRKQYHNDIIFDGCIPGADLFTVTLLNNDANGHAWISTTTGTTSDTTIVVSYEDTLILQAEPTPGSHHHFGGWSDGVTDNPRTLIVTQDSTLSPIFYIDSNTLSVSIQWFDSIQHTTEDAAVEGAGSYPYNTSVTLTAIAYCDSCIFQGWSDGTDENPRSLTLTDDLHLVAWFTRLQPDPVGIKDAIASSILLFQQGLTLTVQGAEEYLVQIYDVSGRLIYSSHASEHSQQFLLPAAGLYLVKIGDLSAKKVVVF